MSFLSQAFQSQSANNTTSIVSAENSTKLPLGGQNGFFQGTFVPSSNYSVVQLSCLSNTLVEIVVESSFDGINYTVTELFFNTQEDIDATRAAPFYSFITLPYVRILITNIDTITNTVFEFCTKLTSTSPPANQIDPAPVIIIGTVQVQDLPLENIAGVLATKPVGAMIINDWYRVASPGDTLGAVWAEIGAYIIPGESSPRVGTLFQCIYVYGDSSPTAGKVWDVQYNTWEGDNLVVTAGDLQVVEKNSGDILTAVNSIDSKIIACDTAAVVVASGNITVDNFPATQPISGTVEVSSIIGALPEGTNSIGSVNAYAYNLSLNTFTALTIESDNNLQVVEKNSGDILTAVNSIDSKIIACDTGSVVVASGNITVDNFPATQPISGSVTISGTAQVQDLPLENIAGVLATRPVGAMVINDWYRVASSGNTSGAVWVDIGAYLVPGESSPRVGSLFKCIYVYGDSSPSAGQVWDEPYNTWEADNLVVTTGDLQVIETNSATISASLVSIDTKIIVCNTDAINISGALPPGASTIGGVNMIAYNAVIPGEVSLNSIANSENNNCLCVRDLAAENIEINANKTNYVENLSPNIYTAGDGFTIDMDTNELRMRNITVLLKVDTTTYSNPSVLIGYSEDEINFFFDGNFASFYDLGGNIKNCVFQRTQVPTRYARVYFNTDTEVVLGIITTQKS